MRKWRGVEMGAEGGEMEKRGGSEENIRAEERKERNVDNR